MKHIFVKSYIFALSLLAISCQSGKGRVSLSALEQSFKDVQSAEQADKNNTNEDNATEEETSSSANVKAKNGLEIPQGKARVPSILLYREGYTASYNIDTKTPNWVAWHLTANHVDGAVKRNGVQFHADDDVPEPRVDTYDYMRSGYDRGHMCPAGDNRWSETAMEQSFLMTNVCPQDHALNSGLWNSIEEQCRTWAKRYGDVFIVCGPIYFKQPHKRIGNNKVQVPEAFYKVILRLKPTPKAIGFVCRNTSAKGHKKMEYVNTVDDVERITGIDFFPKLPDDVEQRVECQADISEW